MDVTLSQKDLLRLFGRTQGVADKKSTMPILSNVLVHADTEGLVRASATDLFMAVTSTASAKVARPGTLALPARDDHPGTRRLAARLATPATVAPIAGDWRAAA